MMPGDMQFFQVVIHHYKPVRAYLDIPCATGRFSFLLPSAYSPEDTCPALYFPHIASFICACPSSGCPKSPRNRGRFPAVERNAFVLG